MVFNTRGLALNGLGGFESKAPVCLGQLQTFNLPYAQVSFGSRLHLSKYNNEDTIGAKRD
jgi:hypothetical protein